MILNNFRACESILRHFENYRTFLTMNFDFTIHPEVFNALLNVDVKTLARFSCRRIRSILPCLVRMSLIAPDDSTKKCLENRKQILTLLSNIEVVNSLVALLSIDFHGLEVDVKQEQNLRFVPRYSFAASIVSLSLIRCVFVGRKPVIRPAIACWRKLSKIGWLSSSKGAIRRVGCVSF